MLAIDLYGRFKDDIIIVARDRALTKHFVRGIKHRSKYYKIKVEEVCDTSTKFLEVRVMKEGSRFITLPEFKPTSLWQPLGADSAHAPTLPHIVGPLHVSLCLAHFLATLPSSRKPNRN